LPVFRNVDNMYCYISVKTPSTVLASRACSCGVENEGCACDHLDKERPWHLVGVGRIQVPSTNPNPFYIPKQSKKHIG